MKANIIDVAISASDGLLTIDLGGALDDACCGCEAVALHDELANLGVVLKLKGVNCRLSVEERIKAKATGLCRWRVANPLKENLALRRKE